MNHDALPRPSDDALAHSDALLAYLFEQIETAGGAIPFARYMELALYAPGLGYYSAGTTKFGAAGDFITAPERSALFGESVAACVTPVLDELGDQAVVFEYGAGTGSLAASLITELERRGSLPAEYWILELSADLQERQQKRIEALGPDVAGRFRWLKKLPEVPYEGVVLANDVFDALPCDRFRIDETGGINGLWVSVESDALLAHWDRPGQELKQQVERLLKSLSSPLPPGYTSEVCPGVAAMVFTLAATLSRGMVLISDYGGSRAEIYHPERRDGTLICHRAHRAHGDPFDHPGLTDLSAWVDFTAVAEAAVDAGLDVAGYTTQAHFLLDCGLPQILERAIDRDPERAAMLAADVRTLTLPGEMGERFKFMALARGLAAGPRGFGLRDLTAGL